MTRPARRRNLNAKTVQYINGKGIDHAALVETYNAHSRHSSDLFGFVDVISFRPDQWGVSLIQVTSTSHMSDRLKKMSTPPLLTIVLDMSDRADIYIWGWPPRGELDEPRIVYVSRELLTGVSDKGIPDSVVDRLAGKYTQWRPGGAFRFFLVPIGQGEKCADIIKSETGMDSYVGIWIDGISECVCPDWRNADLDRLGAYGKGERYDG